MVDITLFRENPDLIRESQRRRYESVELVDEIIELDETWRKTNYALSELNREKKELSKQFKGADAEKKKQLREQSTAFSKQIEEHKEKVAALKEELETALYKVGNLVHESVPVSNDEEHNEIVTTWGEPREEDELLEHDEILYRIGGYEPEEGSEVAGHRGYFLIGPAFWLNQALLQYGFHYLHTKGYTHVQVPFFMNKSVMHAVAQLEDYDESLYKLNDDKYLIATAEQPLCGFHLNKNMNPNTLPAKYCGFSTNFRKEAGSAGRDIRGIFRVHQFEKVEQFIVCAPDKSWEIHEELMETSEGYYKALGLPYRVVKIVSGELNNAAAKKLDLEAWFPNSKVYRELVSNSNCTDYQARRLNCKYNVKQHGKATYCHMLNSTLVASERTLCCLLENYQTPEGVRVPEVLKPYLKPYLGDSDIIPYVRDNFVRDRKGRNKN